MSSESTQPTEQGRRKDKDRVQQVNKCLNEKKRREQENHYMEELAEYISSKFNDLSYPMIKPDKCGILEKTVSEVRRIKDEDSGGESSHGGEGGSDGAGVSGLSGGGGSDVVQQSQVSSSKPSPNILASDVIGPLLLEALDGFLFMVNGDGRLEFVSDNVTQYLRYTQDDLVGKSIFSIINQADHATFRKCLEPILSRSNSGDPQGNRSLTFECSMIVKTNDDDTEDAGVSSLHGARAEPMQILAIWQQFSHDREADASSTDGESQSYLACIARRIGLAEKTITVLGLEQFTTKQDLSGKILDCDTSATIHGEALWREFVDTNILDFCHVNDRERLKKHHDEVLKMGSNTSGIYRFRMQARFVFVQTKSKLFNNPTTKQAEFIMSTHSIVRDCEGPTELRGSLQASLMQAIIGGQSTANGNRDLQRHGNHLGRVSSVSSLNQLLGSDDELHNDAVSLNGLIDMVSCNGVSENSGLGGMNSSGFSQLAGSASAPRSTSTWGSGFHGDLSCMFQAGSGVAAGQRPPRGIKRRATSPGSAMALKSPGASQRSPAGYYSSPASKRSSTHLTPSPLANFDGPQSYATNNKNSYLFQDESDLNAFLDTVQDDVFSQPENHAETVRMHGPSASRPTSQGSGFSADWTSVSAPALPPLQALQQLQVNSVSTFKDNIHMFSRTQRRSKRDQNGNTGVTSSASSSVAASLPQTGLSRGTSRPFQDLRLRELLINDDDGESQGGSSAVDAKKRDVKVLPVLAGARRTPHSADLENTKSPQWLMNPSPQQPQSTTFMDDHPDSSSNKDASSNGRQTASTKNKILIELLRQDDDEDDEDTAEADPGLSSMTLNAEKRQVPTAVSVLKVLGKLEQPVVSALPDTSASPRDQERDVEPTSNSGSGSSNNLLKKLLNSTEDICKSEGKPMKHSELLQKLLSDNSDDVADSNTGPVVESTSNGEIDADGKSTSNNSLSSSETSPTVSEEKAPFCRLGVPKGDKLKEMLTNLWENEGGVKASISASAYKNSKVSVDEAAADSTEFEPESLPPSSSSSVVGSNFNHGGGNESKNKLLLSLLQGSQPTLGSVLNAGNISAVATVTPQMIMAKKAELMGSNAKLPDVKFMRENSTSHPNLPELEQTMKPVATSSTISVSLAVGQPSDTVNWPPSKTKMADDHQNRQTTPALTSQSSVPEKSYGVASEDCDLSILQDCLSQNGFFDSLVNPYIDKLLDEFAQTSEGLDDDTTILSQIEQIIMSSSMSIPEVDSLLQLGGDEKSNFLDPNEEVAIGAIQRQLMSIESAPTAAAATPGSSISNLGSQFATIQDKSTIEGSVSRLPNRSATASVGEASTINDLMKQFRMLESQEDAALTHPTAAQPKTTQSRHVVNQLQKILSSRNQERSNVQPQQQPRSVVAPNSLPNTNLLGRNVSNPTSLKSPTTAQNKTGFTLLDSSAVDVGLIANLSEMMNVPHPPNKVAPSSDLRGVNLPQRLASHSSVDAGVLNGQAGSDLQRALISCSQWSQRDASIMAGGAMLQTMQSGKNSASRPGTDGMMTTVDDLIGSSMITSGGNPHNDIIDDLLESMLPLQQQQQQQQQHQQQQQQMQMRVVQNQQLPGAVLSDVLSEQTSRQVLESGFRDPVTVNRTVKPTGTNHVQSPPTALSRSNALVAMMSASGNLSGGRITSPMQDVAGGLLSPSVGGSLAGGSPSTNGMMSPALGMNAGFSGPPGGGQKTSSGYPVNDLQMSVDGRPFGAVMVDRQSQRNAKSLTSGSPCDPVKSESNLPLAPKVSGTSKNTKQALKLSIQSRTSGGQPQQQQQQQLQRSPASAGIGSSSLSRNEKISQYYLQTGSEMVEGADDCSNLMDCLSPMSDGFLGLPHDGSSTGPFSTAGNVLGVLGSRPQQQPQLPYQRQTSLPDQRLMVSKAGLGAKPDDPMSLGFGQHRDQTTGARQTGAFQLQTLMGDAGSQVQTAPIVQMSDMATNQSHRLGYRQQPAQLQQQTRGGGVKQQSMLAANQIQHLSDAGLQQQQGLGVMQQSGQHHLQMGLMQLSSSQHQNHQQQFATIQHQQNQQQQLVAIQQQQQQQNQQLHLVALQQQQQQQQLATMQLLQHNQPQQLSNQTSQGQQQLGMMPPQHLQRLRQTHARATELQQQQQQMGLPSAHQRLVSQGISTQGAGQWGGVQQTAIHLSPAQTDSTFVLGSHRPESRKLPQSPAEFGSKAELLQYLMSGSPVWPEAGGTGLDTSRTNILQSGGGALQDSNLQAQNGASTQSSNNNLQMMMQGFEAVQENGSRCFPQQSQVQLQSQKSSGSGGFSGKFPADEEKLRQAAFVYQNDNEMTKKARDESRGSSDDFIRLGLQKLINEHVHKDAATNKMRTNRNTTPTLAGNSWKAGAQQDPAATCPDSKISDALLSPLVQSPSLGGQKPTLGDALHALSATHRPKTTTALLEKLLSEETG